MSIGVITIKIVFFLGINVLDVWVVNLLVIITIRHHRQETFVHRTGFLIGGGEITVLSLFESIFVVHVMFKLGYFVSSSGVLGLC